MVSANAPRPARTWACHPKRLVAALCAATTLVAPWSAVAAGEWRAAGKTAWRQSGAVAPAAAEQASDPFDTATSQAPADGPRSVIVRRGEERVAQAPQDKVEFDPFDEPLSDDDAAMPAAEPLRTPGTVMPPQVERSQFDPFDEPEATEPETTEPEVIEPEAAPLVEDKVDAVEEEPVEGGQAFGPEEQSPDTLAPNVDNVAAPSIEEEPAPVEEQPVAEEQAEDAFDIEQAFDAPRTLRPQPRQPEPVAAPPSTDEELEQAEEAIDEEINRREIDRDRPGGVMPNPFRGEEQPAERPFDDNEDDQPRDDAEDVFDDPSDNEEYDDDVEADPLLQQSPGAYNGGLRDGAIQSLTPEQEQARDLQLEQERLAVEEDCEAFIEAVRADDIKSVDLSIRMQGRAGEDYPFDCGFGQELYQPRTWPQVTYLWKAAGLCHKPLYFEQVQLERYGHSWPPVVQPLLSGAHFFATFPLLPYKMGLTTPNECIYTLGYYRPGSCAPYMIDAVPFTWRAAAFEAGAWTGGAFIFP
jgi:hypothetical protein